MRYPCQECGNADRPIGGLLQHHSWCIMASKIQIGWKCPNCGKGLAPHVSECSCSERHHIMSYLGRLYSEYEYPASYNFDVDAFERFEKAVEEYKSRTSPTEA